MKISLKINRIYLLSIISIYLFIACNKDNKDIIPDQVIYIERMYVNDPEYQNLFKNLYGTHLVENVGYKGNGIIIINVGENEFTAYDCSCTNEVREGCFARVDESSIILVKCVCCGSKYELINGSVSQGPAEYPLKQYKTAFDGEYLRVYN